MTGPRGRQPPAAGTAWRTQLPQPIALFTPPYAPGGIHLCQNQQVVIVVGRCGAQDEQAGKRSGGEQGLHGDAADGLKCLPDAVWVAEGGGLSRFGLAAPGSEVLMQCMQGPDPLLRHSRDSTEDSERC